MPPTAFRPSHETPFKSSISSSQQQQQPKRELKGEAGLGQASSTHWPDAFPAAWLDSRQWTYLAEGGKNLLLRYEGPDELPFFHASSGRRVALRLAKVDRKQRAESSSSSSSSQEEDQIDPLRWREEILKADLGTDAILPPLHQLEEDAEGSIRSFLQQMASKIEGMRPKERRRATGIDENDTALYVTEDLSSRIGSTSTLSIEIKPKCGFIPSASTQLSSETEPVKRRISRYRMHRVLKSKTNPSLEEFENWYDPLDLYSGDATRLQKAAGALHADWQKGEGNLRIFIDGEKVKAAGGEGKLEDLVKGEFGRTSFLDLLGKLIVGPSMQSALSNLVKLQSKYDDIDVEGVSRMHQEETGRPLSQADEPEVTLDEYREVIEGRSAAKPYRQAIVKLLLSAMYKDCSIFVRCISGQPPSLYLVDLDPKPIDKLAYFEELDVQICSHFTDWARGVNLL